MNPSVMEEYMARYGRDYRHGGVGHDMEFGNWGPRSGIPAGGGRRGRGSGRRPGSGDVHGRINPGGRSRFGSGYGGAERGEGWNSQGSGRRGRLTGMESLRREGIYGSDYRPGDRYRRGEHGGYRGRGDNRGGGMNPGRDARDRF